MDNEEEKLCELSEYIAGRLSTIEKEKEEQRALDFDKAIHKYLKENLTLDVERKFFTTRAYTLIYKLELGGEVIHSVKL